MPPTLITHRADVALPDSGTRGLLSWVRNREEVPMLGDVEFRHEPCVAYLRDGRISPMFLCAGDPEAIWGVKIPESLFLRSRLTIVNHYISHSVRSRTGKIW
jgi:hypothetical protein